MAYEVLTHERITWTNITRPTPEEIDRLKEQYPNFHPLDLKDALNPNERSKVFEYDEYTFIITHFPRWDPAKRISKPAEVDLFVGEGYVVTVHNGELKPLTNIYEQCKYSPEARAKFMSGSANTLLYTIFDRMVDYMYPMLYKIEANIQEIEDNMFAEDVRGTIEEMSIIRRDIIALRRITKTQLDVVRNLEQIDKPYLRDDPNANFGDIVDFLEKATEIIDDNGDAIANLTDTSNTLASTNINEVMRILTIFSAIMLPLTFVAGAMGMNVPVPFDNTGRAGFWIVSGLMGGVAVIMYSYFKWKRWV